MEVPSRLALLCQLPKCSGEIAGAVCGEIVGMFQEEFPSGLSYTMSESELNASAQLGLSVLNQGGVSFLLGLGGPPRVAF